MKAAVIGLGTMGPGIAATLARGGLEVGECSGVVVAAARELLAGPDADAHRARLGLPDEPSVLLFATEGVTDAETFAQAARLEDEPQQVGGFRD